MSPSRPSPELQSVAEEERLIEREQDRPRVDSLTGYVVWACAQSKAAIERIDRMQDELDAG